MVVVDHLGKPDVTEAPPYPSFAPVLALARHPKVWVKVGDDQIASRMPSPWPDTFPFVAALPEAFGRERMLWGTGYTNEARLVPLAEARRSLQHDLPSLTAADRAAILGTTPSDLFDFAQA